jgi:aspartyl protease family protein
MCTFALCFQAKFFGDNMAKHCRFLHRPPTRRAVVGIVLIWTLTVSLKASAAGEDAPAKFADEVVGKAEVVLAEAGIKRSGKSFMATETAEIARAISGLTRDRRELRLVYQDWKQVSDRIDGIRTELERLNLQDGQYNLQLATLAADDVTTQNKIVGLINATRAQSRSLVTERDRLKETLLPEKRDALNKSESKYAETVLGIRRAYLELETRIDHALKDSKIEIALKVMSTNFETPKTISAAAVLTSLDKRIQKIEQEIFSENIQLDVERGSLFVPVSIDGKSTRMVVDSGATLVSLPAETATELGIQVPADARTLQLIMADGRTINARSVVLKKIRVGQFEAENVAAAVLDPIAAGAEPLLGMSFLQNFKFEIDSTSKSLKMLRVSAE